MFRIKLSDVSYAKTWVGSGCDLEDEEASKHAADLVVISTFHVSIAPAF